MKCFVLVASLLVQLAISAPLQSDPHLKVIYEKGEVTVESEDVRSIEIAFTPGALEITVLHDKTSQRGSDSIRLQEEPRGWSEVSFVAERGPGLDCERSLVDRIDSIDMKPLECFGQWQLRELSADEKAIAAQTKSVLANIDGSLPFKMTFDQGKQIIRGDLNNLRYIKVDTIFDDRDGNSVMVDVHPSSFELENGYMALYSMNTIERFVVEGSTSDCTETNLRSLLSMCNGNLKLRALTDEDLAEAEDLPQDDDAADAKMSRIGALLRQLLSEFMS